MRWAKNKDHILGTVCHFSIVFNGVFNEENGEFPPDFCIFNEEIVNSPLVSAFKIGNSD